MAAEAEAKRRGADDAVFVDGAGTVLEGRRPRRSGGGAGARSTRPRWTSASSPASRARPCSARGRDRLRGRGGPLRPHRRAPRGRRRLSSSSVRGDAGDRAGRRADRPRPGGGLGSRRRSGRCRGSWRLPRMSAKIRLGGMALSNGVLVHGPPPGPARSGRTRARSRSPATARSCSHRIQQPFLRGPLRLAESFRDDPRAPPQAPAGAPAVRAPVRGRCRGGERADGAGRASLDEARRDGARAARRGALSLAPALLALRGGELAAYHGAERLDRHVRARREARRGARALRLTPVDPLLAASAVGNVLASHAPRTCAARPDASSIGAVGVAVEVFAWMTKHRGTRSRRRSRGRATSCSAGSRRRPSPEQLEVAEAALCSLPGARAWRPARKLGRGGCRRDLRPPRRRCGGYYTDSTSITRARRSCATAAARGW